MMDSSQPTSNHSKRPKNTQFHQQQLPAWQPILTAGNVAPIFFCLGLAFIGIGVALVIASNSIIEYAVPYTHCKDATGIECSARINEASSNYNLADCVCFLTLTIDQPMTGDVVAYYGLTNFYQNHRLYVKSRDDVQLGGSLPSNLNADCSPYDKMQVDNVTKYIAPCGLIANSLFNDTYELTLLNGSSSLVVFNFTGIAWKTDLERKFGKPPADTWPRTVKPPNWRKSALERSPEAYSGDEALVVWMRTAALPTFRKPWARVMGILGSQDTTTRLPAGNYSLKISYAYPVTQFGGTKKFILSTQSWIGGKNLALGVTYLLAGGLLLVVSVLFVLLHVYAAKRDLPGRKTL